MRWQRQPLLLAAALLCVLAACTPPEPPRTVVATPGWSTDVTGVSEVHLDVDYWIDRADDPDELLSSGEEIAAFTRNAFDQDPNMVDLATIPDTLPGSDVAELIRAVSKPYNGDLWYKDGEKLTPEDYDRYTANLDLAPSGDDPARGGLPQTANVRFGMIVERASMRTWPTDDVVFKSPETIDLDRFQENGLFPSDIVVILHESADGQWYFARSYNYAAWVRKEFIALGQRDEILAYQDAEPFLVIAGNRAVTNFNPTAPEISELQLEMGTRLPLIEAEDVDHNVDGQNPYASYIVQLPRRNDAGELEFYPGLIARNQDIHIGYMPYTRRNVLHQAFKFLGERYGWGHSYNARDCTGLVQEVYKTFGFAMPRNSGQQGTSDIGDNLRFSPEATAAEKLAALEQADIGDLIYSTGHVMLFLGMVDGEPYVIHDLSGSGWIDEEGDFQEGVLNGVSVTPMTRVHASPEETYFEQVYAVKRLR